MQWGEGDFSLIWGEELSVSGTLVKIYCGTADMFVFLAFLGGLIYPCTKMNWACVNVHISYIIDILHDLHKHATSYLQDVTRIRVHITDPDGNGKHHHHQNGMICSLSYDPLSLMITLKSIHNMCWPTYNLLDWGNKTKIYLYTVNLILLNTFFTFFYIIHRNMLNSYMNVDIVNMPPTYLNSCFLLS